MSPPESEAGLALLREIRDNQRQQIEAQAEALRLQREHFDMARRQLDRAERINNQAEALQNRGAWAMKLVIGVLAFAVLGLVALLVPPLLRAFG